MTAKEYQACTWREFLLRYSGYQLRRAHEFEGPRLIAYKLLWAHMDHQKGRIPPIQEFWPLLSDEAQVKESVDQDEAEYARLKEIMRKAAENRLN